MTIVYSYKHEYKRLDAAIKQADKMTASTGWIHHVVTHAVSPGSLFVLSDPSESCKKVYSSPEALKQSRWTR